MYICIIYYDIYGQEIGVFVPIFCDFGSKTWEPGQGVWRLEWNGGSLGTGNLKTISGFGEPLMETVCRDACSGHDITRVSGCGLVKWVWPCKVGVVL